MAADSDSDEDFVTYGTPLEPLEEDEPLRKPVPIHEQTVKDEKGRYKRFHGAFTGGFSAGYFNSVGTKEGWAPSTFVSSREQKAEKGRARPEDFMDEEDFSEHGIAPSEISRTEEFGSGRRDQLQEKARLISSLSATIPGDTLLKELIAPARTSIGVELLRKMGWKDGQGVGPRMKRKKGKQRTESSGHRIYGCAPPRAGSEDSEEEDEDDEEFAPENVTFAPKDVTPIDFTPKENVHGLGYSGLNPLKALLGSSGSSSASGHINLFSLDSDRTTQLFGQRGGAHRSRKGPTGQAFGVGAMEDDDEDVYHRDSMSNYDRVLGGKESGDGLYGWTAPQQYKKNKTGMSVDASYLGKILEGFTLSSQAIEQKTIFPPPVLPSDYRPVHHFRPVFNVSGVSPALAQALKASKGQLTPDSGPQPGRHQLDSAQRGQLLGETALQGPSSIFELLSSEDRQKLASLRSTSLPPAATSAPPSSSSHDAMASAGVEAAKLTAQRAMVSAGVEAAKLTAQRTMASRFQPQRTQQQQQEEQALSAWKAPTAQGAQTFKPFEGNASKQARYDLYLSKLRQGDRDSLELCLDTNMTEWERSRERDEFVRAAVLYKPASSFLSSRFTRGKQDDNNDDNIEVNRDQENDVDDKQAAVKMKMFGQLTRDTFEWHPDKLLCKRFNVPDPFPGSGLVGMPKVKRDKFSVFNFLNVAESPTATASPHTHAFTKPAETSRRSRWDKEERQKDPLSEFISVARNTASGPQPDQSTSTNPPSTTTGTAAGPLLSSGGGGTTAASPTIDIKVETKSPEHPDGEKKKSDEEDAGGEEEEEEEEETRPPMDLFKAIFDSSSDDKSSSEDDEDDEDTGRGASEVSSLFNTVPVASTPQTETPLAQLTVLPPAGQTVPAVASSSQNIKQEVEEEEEFGPKLPPPFSVPPPSSVPAGEGMSSLTPLTKEEVKHSRRSNKNKKRHKSKKDKKKKKHKKHSKASKHKAKQKKKDTSDSSAEDSEADGQGTPTTDATTQELLKRLKTIRSQPQQW